jgi:ABC-2 type transport system permease protein
MKKFKLCDLCVSAVIKKCAPAPRAKRAVSIKLIKMNEVLTLLKPRIWPLKNRGLSKANGNSNARLFLLGSFGLLFWSGIFAVSWRVLVYFKGIEDIGDILGYKLLSMMLVVSFALLLFSSILTSLSKLYLSRDLLLVHSFPVSSYKIFITRWIDSTIDSAWMVIIYTLPVFISYGIVYQVGVFYYFNTMISMMCLAVIASAISTLLVMAAVIIIPASRMKSVFILMGILFFVVIYLAIRLSQPELLVDPEVFDSVMVYITSLQTPSSPFLPSSWAYDSIRSALSGSFSNCLFFTALSLSFAGMIVSVMIFLSDAIYFKGFSKTQNASARLIKYNVTRDRIFNFLPGPVKSFAVKEIKTFLRDQTQWTQIFLIAALVVIYVYNFKVLPLEKSPIKTVYLQNLFSFLNMGLALFVLTAVTARFAYPAVSLEREAFWLVKTSPLSIRTFLWIKFFIYYLPLLILTEILIVATNILLQVTPFMMILSTLTIFFIVPGIVAMGIGLGAAYPDFKAENPTQTITSFGGLVFMIVCAGYIGLVVIIEAGPVYHLFMADIRNKIITLPAWIWIVGSFTLVLVLSLLAISMPMRFGERRLSQLLT